MLTNEIKKGMRIRLSNGWEATMMDNCKGNTRLADVEGWFREIGSVYAHDIVAVLVDGVWKRVEHTDKQKTLKRNVHALFGG